MLRHELPDSAASQCPAARRRGPAVAVIVTAFAERPGSTAVIRALPAARAVPTTSTVVAPAGITIVWGAGTTPGALEVNFAFVGTA